MACPILRFVCMPCFLQSPSPPYTSTYGGTGCAQKSRGQQGGEGNGEMCGEPPQQAKDEGKVQVKAYSTLETTSSYIMYLRAVEKIF